MIARKSLLALGLCAMALAACETSGPSRGGIYEGPVGGPVGGGALVVERQPPLRELPRDYGRADRGGYEGRGGGDRGYDGRPYDGGRAGGGRDLYDDRDRGDGRYGDRRDPCLDIPGYDPRYDRCDR